MSEKEFASFVATLRAVYMGRTTMAESVLWTLDPIARADWYRLADTFRALIGDIGCMAYTHDHGRMCS